MKKVLFFVFAALFSLSITAQQIKDFYSFDKKSNSIKLDISKISLFEQRVHLIYLLNNDDRFDVTVSDQDGVFIIKRNSNSYNFNLEDTFNQFYSEETVAFNSMSKAEIGEQYSGWKSSLPNNFMASMMMDMYVQNRQNNHCNTADPFCTDNGMYQFPAGVNAGSGESGPNYSCLSTTPNPAWYYMRMSNSGGMTIYMYSTPSEDIDFCCWGPFEDPVTPCPSGLTGAKVVSCSYSANPTENCQIPNNAQSGQYYILVITNFSNHPCNINFSKTAGSGTTDCSILEPFLTASSPCVGSSLVLEANVIEGAQYNWTGPDNQTHNGRTWTRNNATLNMAGTYSCHVVAGSQSGTETINAVVLPNVTANFTNTDAIAGEPVQFTGTETTNPSGHTSEITVRQWNFGDGSTSTSVNPTHTYANPGDYQVSYHVAITGGNSGECGDTKTKTIQIRNQLNATATSSNGTSFCDGDANPSLTATATGGYGNYTYSWSASPTCPIDYPNSATTTAHPAIGTTTFTCVVSDGHSTVTKTISITVNAIPDVTITGPNPPHISYGASTTLSVPQLSGATYSWTSNPANQIQSGANTYQITTKNLTAPTTFYVTVSKNDCSDSNQMDIAVGDALYGNVTITGQPEICSGESTTLKINPSGGTEIYNYNWQPANMIEGSNTVQTITTKALTSSTTFTCTITDTDNHTYTATAPTVIVHPIPEAMAYVEDHGTTFQTFNVLAGNYVILSMSDVTGATYSWEPANMINNFIDPNHRMAKTVNLTENDNLVFTATVTTSSGCSNQDNVTVVVHSALTESYISASSNEICEDHSVNLTAHARGGTGNYSYHWIPESYYSNPYSRTTKVHPNSNNHSYTCIITDTGIDDHTNNRIEKSINIGILEKPSVNNTLIGQSYVLPGISYMPYIYEYNIQVSSLHGYDIQNAEYTWEILSYYNTPNHVAGTPYTSTWIVVPDETDKNKAYVAVDEEGNALLQCKITTACGTTISEKFIFTEGYGEGESIDETNYDSMISVFPNPSNGELYIGFSEQLVSSPITISIYNYNGELIDQIQGNTSTNVTHFSMNGYVNGLYLIRINGNDFCVTKKFVLDK